MKKLNQKLKIKYEISAGGIVYKRRKARIETQKNAEVLWLICQHSKHKGWVFPKGLVGDKEKNEDMRQAALREVREEGGVRAKIITNKPIITNYQYMWEGVLIKKTVYYFLMEYVSGDPQDHDWEVSQAKFVSEEEVKKTLTYKSDWQAFEKILQLLKKK